MPGPHRERTNEKVKDFKGTFKRFLTLLKPHKFTFTLSFMFAFIGVLASTYAPKLLGKLITVVSNGVVTGVYEENLIVRFVLMMLCMYIITPVFRFFQHFIIAGVSGRIVADLRSTVNSKLDKLPLRYFDNRTHGEIMSRITNDIDRIDESLQEGISQGVISAFTILCIVVMMFTTNVVMTLISLITIPLFLIIVTNVFKFSQKFFVANQKYLGELNGHVEQIYSGHSVVKAFNHEAQSIEDFRKINNELCDAGWKSNFYSSTIHPLTGFAGNIGYILVVVAGALKAASGSLSIGEIQAFVQYVRRFNMPIQEVANISNVFQSTLAAAERIFELLDEEEEVPDGNEFSDPAKGEIKFDRVSFSYTEKRKLIENLNLDIKQGTKVAIVGPTGAGKTTIVNLLMRFYDVTGGAISVDGIDIRKWPRDVLRDQFGMVLQDTWLFEGTIAQNIAYGDGTGKVDMPKVRECAEKACADHFISALPQSYDFVINEEASNVSQGEKQLLTIARAFMSDPRILILDEATSNVDTRTERLVQKAMENLMEGRTSFIIAHRLSTIRDADIILVIDNGNIVEQGKHEELLAKGGFYSKLYMSQFRGEVDG